MKIAVCDDDQAIRKELLYLIQKQVPEVDIAEYKSGGGNDKCQRRF